MNKAIRIVSIILLAVLIVAAFSVPVLAGTNNATGIDLNEFTGDTSGAGGVTDLFNRIIGIVQVVGTGIAVIMLIVLAIKYLMAAPSEKADIKKGALVYVVAAVILFAAVNILAAIQSWSSTIDLVA